MLGWIVVGAYVIFVVVLNCFIAHVPLSWTSSTEQRDAAFKMFRIVWTTSGITTLAVLLTKLHAAGLLS